MSDIRPIRNEDICLWPDDTWCYFEDLEEYLWMSDDFEVIPCDSTRWNEIVNG
ncbi:hypothetical protein H4CHR_02890 [Variovorax sp. PBS-H4]|uniref:hypothetical protein n=1 Tax=Variovorax sp. PBS-H4 TaxID=434008 RepID=UPI001318D843|nr:hypothetical protein [Variovorax sp. PBS-H4]VTU31843.1 hypothetical protein H4CHR_02890 [Variovorax sp. PBS-H4]